MTFDSIQPLALRIREDALPLMRDCITLPFPKHWATEFKQLQALVQNRPLEKTNIPIVSLNHTLRAVLPPIISIARRAASYSALSQGRPWLYMQAPIDPAILISIVHAWARVVFNAAPTEKLNHALSMVQTHDVKWNIDSLNLVDWRANTQGTATPANQDQFIIFPDYVAASLSGIVDGFQYGDHQLHFRRSSITPGQRGAELTSWPPLQVDDALYSVVLTFTMQTVPFQSYPALHCDVSLRRWAGPGRVFLKQRASAYISTSLPFICGLENWTNHLQVASLKRKLSQDDWTSQWDDQLVDILKQLRSKVSLIDAEKLTNTPDVGQQDWENAAAIVYSTRMKWHRIGAGITIRERSQLFDQVAALLSDVFEPVAPMPRVKMSRRGKIGLRPNPFSSDYKVKKKKIVQASGRPMNKVDEEIWPERRALIREAIGNQLSIEICAVTTEVREHLFAAIRDVLGVSVSDDSTQSIATPEIAISITQRSLGGFTDNLEVGSGKGASAGVRDATQRRINEIVRQLPRAEGPTLMLAEILPKDKYAKNSDPKSALRIGIGRSRRLVQFITADGSDAGPSSDEADEEESVAPLYYRAVNALLDGLRQLGVPGNLPAPAETDKPCSVIGAWLINKKSSKLGTESYTLPVLVRISSADTTILAMAPGFTDWLPYREALLELSKTDVLGNQTRRADYTAFLKTQLRNAVSEQHDTLLVCHAQNMRETWKWLSNTNLVRDNITFQNGEQATPVVEWPGLRIVRVRDAQSHETPEWFAEKDGWRSVASGLFKVGERVYASTHAKPKQMTSYSHYFSKAEGWSSPTSPERIIPPKPNRTTWNPGLYELTIAALQSEDKDDYDVTKATPDLSLRHNAAVKWAYLAHDLRKSNLHFEDATALPLPLHLAKLMEEYILSVEIQEDEEE